MKNLNPIKKELSKKDRKISVQDPSRLLSDFCSAVIKIDEENAYDS